MARARRSPFRTTLLALGVLSLSVGSARADDDVMLQGFYWDCPQGWYEALRAQVLDLKRAGFSSVWLPPPSKGASGKSSMGYDLFDHYDLGEYDQKGSVATRFGTVRELKRLVDAFHANKIQAYADIVLNHMIGGELEDDPITGQKTWTKFTYPHHTFEKSWRDFHPTWEHRDLDAPYHDHAFGEDLCQAHDYVNKGLKDWGDWLTKKIGYDGYRLDFVKGIDPNYVKEWLSSGAMKGKFAVSECWDANADVLDRFVNDQGGLTSVFDFPLFYTIKDMCNDGSGRFDMRRLDGAGYAARNAFRAVTFVENHDTDRSDPVRTDKTMAYAFILALEGCPCVFYKDYRVYNLKAPIDLLIKIRKKLAAGKTRTLYADQDLFIAQREGDARRPGLVLVLNDDPSAWKGAWVTVKPEWAGKSLKDHTGRAMAKRVAADGRVELWAPPRGYAVYSLDVPLDDPPPARPASPATPGRRHARTPTPGVVGSVPGGP